MPHLPRVVVSAAGAAALLLAIAAPGGAGTAEPTRDEVTPLLVSSLHEPIPVRGSDGKVHVAYEVLVLNASPRPAVLERIDTVTGPDDEVVASLGPQEIAARLVPLGPLVLDPEPTNEIASGQSVTLLFDDVYDSRAEVPETFAHRFVASFGDPPEGSHPVASQYPSSLDEVLGPMRLGEGAPLRIGPPLEGDGWLAANACCTNSSHRGAEMPMNGRLNATERYAIDWIQVDPSRVGDPSVPDGLLPSFEGDPSLNESYLAYDEPLLAVADATVVSVVDELEEGTPQELPEGLPIERLAGNSVILDLGDGFYALYSHAKPDSISVEEGDRVKRGEVIGRLGSTGNSSEPHLHFHVMRGPAPLAATNWPYEISDFDVVGSFGDDGFVEEPAPGPRRNELPLALNVVDFPS